MRHKTKFCDVIKVIWIIWLIRRQRNERGALKRVYKLGFNDPGMLHWSWKKTVLLIWWRKSLYWYLSVIEIRMQNFVFPKRIGKITYGGNDFRPNFRTDAWHNAKENCRSVGNILKSSMRDNPVGNVCIRRMVDPRNIRRETENGRNQWDDAKWEMSGNARKAHRKRDSLPGETRSSSSHPRIME